MGSTDPYDLVGQVLDGQFRVDRVIGEGGFSVVYRGLHVGLDEPVAIKCLKLQAQLGSALVETFIRRFRDESKIHYRLSRGSLHIARTIAAGTTMAPSTGALVPYMVLEWLEGYTLGEELRARRTRGETGRPLADVIRMLDPVADAMAFAHAQGVVHRDLSPSNIFVAHAQGSTKLKVLDFGVAKVISDHALSLGPRAATLGMIRMFTPAYGAPEQFNDTLGKVAPYTDVYALALMVVELLTDRTPVEGEHFGELADKVLDRDKRPSPRAMGAQVGDAVEGVILRALSVDPALRPSDIGEMWGMLKNAVSRDADQRRTFPEGLPAAPRVPDFVGAPMARPVDPLASTAAPSIRNMSAGFGHGVQTPPPAPTPAQPAWAPTTTPYGGHHSSTPPPTIAMPHQQQADGGRWTASRPPEEGPPLARPPESGSKRSTTPLIFLGLGLVVLLGGGAAYAVVKLILH